MRRTSLLAAVLVAGVAGMFMFASAAQADTIAHYAFSQSVYGSTDYYVTLSTGPSNTAGVFTVQFGNTSGSNYVLEGYGLTTENTGEVETSHYTLTTSGTAVFGPNNGLNRYDVASGSSLTSSLTITDLSDSDAETYTGTVNWQYWTDDSPTPSIHGTATVDGMTYYVDMTLKNIGTTLGDFALTSNNTVSVLISSGQLDLAPEPMSMLLLMFGFAVIGLVAIRRKPVTETDVAA